MSYQQEKNGDIVISGFDKGIGDSPYAGISDMRNVNIISVPGEASVNFSTAKISAPAISGNLTIASADAGNYYFTQTGSGIGFEENYMAITFSAQNGLLPNGNADLGKIFWIKGITITGGGTGATFQLTSDYQQNTVIQPSNGTGTFTIFNIVQPKYFTTDNAGKYWMIDKNGNVWSNNFLTTSGYWTHTGNRINNHSNGNGIVYYEGSTGTGYIIIFHNSSADYTLSAAANISWVYQWDITAGTTGSWSATPTSKLKTAVGVNNSHEAMVAPDSRVYFCDSNYVDVFYENTGQAFDPATKATYTGMNQTALLPKTDKAQCLTFLGTNILVGGTKNIIYPWDRFDTHFNYPILVAEYNIQKMITVNTNTYIFVGNRGRIYYTNGTQAQLYKKIPDHLSNTVEPYFAWGGCCSVKNQLYFSAQATTNGNTAIGDASIGYGGVWAIDLDTKAIRLTNKLSYGTYAGYATAMIPIINPGSNPSGTGLYLGWDSGATTYGIDGTIGTPYVAGESYVISDMIPIGTLLKPTTSKQLEFKLATPLLASETVEIQTASYWGDTFTTVGTTTGSASTTILSGNFPLTVQKQQWILVKAILTAKSSSPSYNRLTELRIIK